MQKNAKIARKQWMHNMQKWQRIQTLELCKVSRNAKIAKIAVNA